MATSKRKTANEPVTNGVAEPSSDGQDSEIARRAYDRYQRRGWLTDTISTTGLRRNVNLSPLGMLRLTEVLVQAVVAGMLTAFGRVSAFNEREIHMLDHIILTVSDVERSLKFYTAALKPLKIKMFLPYKGADGHPDLWGFGDGQKAFFWLKQGKPDPASIHWGFIAENNKAVDAFYKAAIATGAKDNISPRARLEYYSGYYAADVFDPDGYTFEVVHKS